MRQSQIQKTSAFILALFLVVPLLTSCINKPAKFEDYLEQGEYTDALVFFGKSIAPKEELRIESSAILEDHFISRWKAYLRGELAEEEFSQIYENISIIIERNQIPSFLHQFEDHYGAIKQSRMLYEKGISLVKDDKLVEAISAFSQVQSIEGAPYQEAKNQIEKTLQLYRENILATASRLAENGNYDGALRVIEDAIGKVGTHDSFSQSLQEIFKRSLTEKIHGLYDAGDYLAVLKIYEDARSNPYYKKEQDLEEFYRTTLQAYIEGAIEQASELFGDEKNYDAAIKVIKLAIVEVGEEPLLVEELEYYNAYKPVWLSSLDYFYEDGYFYTKDSISDNLGESYSNVFYARESITRKHHSRVILLNGQYNRMTGRVIVGIEDKNKDEVGEVSFFGDGDLLFASGEMGAGVKPIDFEIDLTGILELRIQIYSIAHGWGGYNPYLVDTVLFKR